MKEIIKYTIIALFLTGMISCEKLLEPIDENRISNDYVETDPISAEGYLMHAYTGLISHTDFTATATDDAVNNNLSDSYKRMATGQLSAKYNQVQRWSKYTEIFYINKFIDIIKNKSVRWNEDDTINLLFEERLLGEAIAMRGLYHFYILQAHAGVDASGELLGIPYYKEFIPADGNFNKPRLTFEETVDEINADFDSALVLLPRDYSDSRKYLLPKHEGYDWRKYKVVNGAVYNLRISGRIVRALQARLELFAASPSFLNGAGHYEKAANYAGEILSLINGVSGLFSTGNEFYKTDNNLLGDSKDILKTEFLWRSSIESGDGSTWLEEQNYPPSANGSGNINPTHNLVSAFPLVNGYPATEANGYDPQNPYENRDPRLKEYIVCTGDHYPVDSISTGVGGGIDRVDSIIEKSTRTGYYLKKLLRGDDVRINNDGSTVSARHVNVYFRYTELFLIFAEAANEIGGPDFPIYGLTARNVIAAIRERADIMQPDNYLSSISTKFEMRELIRNERRIELCFEGHRFWDLRRWGLPLNEPAKGYFYNGTGFVELPVVETRDYPAYAKYLPIPNTEILRTPALKQNQGW